MFNKNNSNIFFQEADEALKHILHNHTDALLFLLTNDKVYKNCFSKIKGAFDNKTLELIVISDGELYKSINSCNLIWQTLINHNASRNSILINLGGGVILDLGGFAASVYKRGINFINIPTTLLAQADVSLGDKTGVNFLNIKNSIGTFSSPLATIIDTNFLYTLNNKEFISGYAEVIKHALVSDSTLFEDLVNYKYSLNPEINKESITELLTRSLNIKHDIISKDPYENGERKKLNFGHNIAHSLESLYLNKGKNILHGYAVAFGIAAESYLSYKLSSLSLAKLYDILKYTFKVFDIEYEIDNNDLDLLYTFMLNDKKNGNLNEGLNFTLLKDIGEAGVDNYIKNEDIIKEAVQFTINENSLL